MLANTHKLNWIFKFCVHFKTFAFGLRQEERAEMVKAPLVSSNPEI